MDRSFPDVETLSYAYVSPSERIRLLPDRAVSQELMFYSIPTEKEIAVGRKPDLLKRLPSGHEEPVTKILLLDVDKVGSGAEQSDVTW